MKEEGKEEKERNKVVGWSTEVMEEVRSKREFKDTEEMVQWRSINQEEVDNEWKVLYEKMEEVEEAKKCAFMVSRWKGESSEE